MYKVKHILNSGEHEVIQFIPLNICKKLDITRVVDVFSTAVTRT